MEARERADLAELADWVGGLRAAAHKARDEDNAIRTLARRKLVILQPYSLTAYGLPMARHRERLAETPRRRRCEPI